MTDASSRLPWVYFEHNSCAVKLHAYTLDKSCDLASAVQHYLPFPQAGMQPESAQASTSGARDKNFLREPLSFAEAS
jgi:hypothetical protein